MCLSLVERIYCIAIVSRYLIKFHFLPFTENSNKTFSVLIYGTKYSGIDQVKFICLSRPYLFKVFKNCLLQILLGPFRSLASVLVKTYHHQHVFLSLGSNVNGPVT